MYWSQQPCVPAASGFPAFQAGCLSALSCLIIHLLPCLCASTCALLLACHLPLAWGTGLSVGPDVCCAGLHCTGLQARLVRAVSVRSVMGSIVKGEFSSSVGSTGSSESNDKGPSSNTGGRGSTVSNTDTHDGLLARHTSEEGGATFTPADIEAAFAAGAAFASGASAGASAVAGGGAGGGAGSGGSGNASVSTGASGEGSLRVGMRTEDGAAAGAGAGAADLSSMSGFGAQAAQQTGTGTSSSRSGGIRNNGSSAADAAVTAAVQQTK